MSNRPAAPARSAARSAAVALLSADLGPACTVSTLPADPSHSARDAWASGEPAVLVGWRAVPSAKAPGLVPQPILVWPVPETGEYVVSYRQTCVMSVLLDLPAAVRGLMAMAQNGDYRPAAPCRAASV